MRKQNSSSNMPSGHMVTVPLTDHLLASFVLSLWPQLRFSWRARGPALKLAASGLCSHPALSYTTHVPTLSPTKMLSGSRLGSPARSTGGHGPCPASSSGTALRGPHTRTLCRLLTRLLLELTPVRVSPVSLRPLFPRSPLISTRPHSEVSSGSQLAVPSSEMLSPFGFQNTPLSCLSCYLRLLLLDLPWGLSSSSDFQCWNPQGQGFRHHSPSDIYSLDDPLFRWL